MGLVYLTDYKGLFYIIDYMGLFFIRDYMGQFYNREFMGLTTSELKLHSSTLATIWECYTL